MAANIILSVRGFEVRFGQKLVLDGVDLDLEETGITHLMGPCGSGKSTLLRSLAGLNRQSPLYHQAGRATYLGQALGLQDYPSMLEQKPGDLLTDMHEALLSQLPERSSLDRRQQDALVQRLFELYGLEHLSDHGSAPLTSLPPGDRRLVLILGRILSSPALLLLDEPTAGLEPAEAERMLDTIARIAEYRSVLLVQHNQQQAKQLGGNSALLAGGRIHEFTDTWRLLSDPESEAAKEFKDKGTCAAPSPDTDPVMLDQAYVERYKPVVKPRPPIEATIPFGPRGFRWIDPGRLAATPRPGLLADQLLDLKALAKAGITQLVSLEETATVSREAAENEGIQLTRLPIIDMQAPGHKEALVLSKQIDHWLTLGQAVAVHCKAGLGRTGTVICSYLVYKGMNAAQALHKIRCVDPRMVQSDSQEAFITEFERRLSAAGHTLDHTDRVQTKH